MWIRSTGKPCRWSHWTGRWIAKFEWSFSFVVTAKHLIVRVSTALVQIMFVFHAYIYALCLPVIKPQHSSLKNIPKREMCLFILWTLINSPKLVLISTNLIQRSFSWLSKVVKETKLNRTKQNLSIKFPYFVIMA